MYALSDKQASAMRTRVRAWLAAWIERHIVADDPAPEPSRLDRLDGV